MPSAAIPVRGRGILIGRAAGETQPNPHNKGSAVPRANTADSRRERNRGSPRSSELHRDRSSRRAPFQGNADGEERDLDLSGGAADRQYRGEPAAAELLDWPRRNWRLGRALPAFGGGRARGESCAGLEVGYGQAERIRCFSICGIVEEIVASRADETGQNDGEDWWWIIGNRECIVIHSIRVCARVFMFCRVFLSDNGSTSARNRF